MTIGGAGGGGGGDSSSGTSGGGSFAYGGRSLDELRSLAGSVDTARVADAQSDFTRIAAQMDDVVSQLVAIQSRIPSWWHGATADQAITKFGQVINHAQTAYTIADGAGRALSTCTTVIAEQQAAMATVPELSKPRSALEAGEAFTGGATLVQQSALLAEEQRYEAARRRAVEVVNGMAAQFLETTGKLRSLDTVKSDAGFREYSREAQIAPRAEQKWPTQVAATPPRPTANRLKRRSTEHQYTSATEMRRAVNTPSDLRDASTTSQRGRPSNSSPNEARNKLFANSSHMEQKAFGPTATTGLTANEPDGSTDKVRSIEDAPKRNEVSSQTSATKEVINSREDLKGPASLASNRNRTSPNSQIYARHPDEPPGMSAQTSLPHADRIAPSVPRDRYADGAFADSESQSKLCDLLSAGQVSQAGVPSVQRFSSPLQQRSRRPDYLTEPKSIWDFNPAVAPWDGILTPEWDAGP